MASARWAGLPDLKMPEPPKTPAAPSCIIIAASAGFFTTRQAPAGLLSVSLALQMQDLLRTKALLLAQPENLLNHLGANGVRHVERSFSLSNPLSSLRYRHRK